MFKNHRLEIYIFTIFFLTRYFFIFLSNFNNFQLQPDSYWYDKQSNEILLGNYNLLRPLFITAPFFSYFQALIKLLFSNYWIYALEFFQVLISSISGIFFYKLSNQILICKKTSLLATIIFCFYPLTLWLVGTFTQDIWFQSFLIIFFYFFFNSLEKKSTKLLIVSSLLFSLTYLTKSHILLFSIFIPIIILFKKKINLLTRIKFILIFSSISFFCSLPYGLYNLAINNTYVIGSNGLGGTFLTGHNDDAYLNHLKLNELTPEQKQKFRSNLYSIYDELKPRLDIASPSDKQSIMLSEGIKWVKNNPKKTYELKIYHIKRFFTPGISSYWYSFYTWLIVFIITFPIYLFAYIAICHSLIYDFNKNFWILGLIISLLFFSSFFYFSGRFRVITLEPYYIIYASNLIFKLLTKLKKKYN